MGMKATLDVLNEMVEAKVIGTYAIAGAIAAYNYIEAAATEDLDVLVSFDEPGGAATGLILLDPVYSYLKRRGYVEFSREGILIEGWPVQFLPVASSLDAEALAEAPEVDLTIGAPDQVVRTRVLRAEHLMAIALSVGRPKDRLRIAQFIEEEAFDAQYLGDVLDRHSLESKWRDFLRKLNL